MCVALAGAGCSAHPVPPPQPQVTAIAVPDAGVADAMVPRPRYLVGESCLNARLKPTHVFPRFLGGAGEWLGDSSDVSAPMRDAPQRFTVLGFDGAKHGELVTAENAVGSDPRGFVGDYSGPLGVCNFRVEGGRGAMSDCIEAGACGLAVAVVGDTSPPPEPIDIMVAGTCVADGKLIVDLDRDGLAEVFPLDAFLDQAEIAGSRDAGPACKPQFTWYGTKIGASVVDVLGAGDFDQDGKLELVIAIRSRETRIVAMYGSQKDPTRLARLAVVSH